MGGCLIKILFAGVFVLNELGSGDEVASRIKTLLGWALIVAGCCGWSCAAHSRRSSWVW